MSIVRTHHTDYIAYNPTPEEREARHIFSLLRSARRPSVGEVVISNNRLSSLMRNNLQTDLTLTHLRLTDCTRDVVLPEQISASITTLSFENTNPYIPACVTYSNIHNIICCDYTAPFHQSLPWPKDIESLTLEDCTNLSGLDLTEYPVLSDLRLMRCYNVESIAAWPPNLVYLQLTKTNLLYSIPPLNLCTELSYLNLIDCLPRTEQILSRDLSENIDIINANSLP